MILFYIFLTGAFIPQDIADVISGLSICLNPFSYLQIKFKGDHSFVSDYFDFGLENSNLEVFEIKSDSTIVNITSFLTSMLIYWILHFLIHCYFILFILYLLLYNYIPTSGRGIQKFNFFWIKKIISPLPLIFYYLSMKLTIIIKSFILSLAFL